MVAACTPNVRATLRTDCPGVRPFSWTGSGLGCLRLRQHLLFVGYGRAIPQGGVQPHRVVEAFDVAEAGGARLGLRGEAPSLEQLALERREEALASRELAWMVLI